MKKKWTIKNILKELMITLLMIFVISMVMNYLRQPDTSKQPDNMQLIMLDGKERQLYAEGRATIVHFWATWCPTCKLEAPNIESIQEDAYVVTVAVNSGSDEALREFMMKEGYSYPVVNDHNGELAKQFNVEVFPTTFIYDKDGVLKFSEVGYSTTLGLKTRLSLID